MSSLEVYVDYKQANADLKINETKCKTTSSASQITWHKEIFTLAFFIHVICQLFKPACMLRVFLKIFQFDFSTSSLVRCFQIQNLYMQKRQKQCHYDFAKLSWIIHLLPEYFTVVHLFFELRYFNFEPSFKLWRCVGQNFLWITNSSE